MKKYIVPFLFYFVPFWHGNAQTAENALHVVYQDGVEESFPLSNLDSLKDSQESHKLLFSYPTGQNGQTGFKFENAIAESSVNLQKNDVKNSFNQLISIGIEKKNNPSLLNDVNVTNLNDGTVSVVIPYLTDFSRLKVDLKSTGAYIYLNGRKYSEGESYDFSNPVTVKVVAFDGCVRTYQLTVCNSGQSIIKISSGAKIGKDWIEKSLQMLDGDGNIKNQFNVEVKGRGSHFKEGLKNSYNIKVSEKKSFGTMPAAKRWVLLSSQHDASLLRIPLGFELAKQFFSFDWTPSAQLVELVVDDNYLGAYYLTEQIRVCRGRIESGYIFSAESESAEDDDAFVGLLSKQRFIMEDPETGFAGTQLLRISDKFNAFEKILWSGQNISSSVANMQSFADWYVFSEWLKNEDMMTSDDYLTMNEDYVLSMGPIWEQSQSFGVTDRYDIEGWIAADNPLVGKLLENGQFKKLVKERLSNLLSNEAKILQLVNKICDDVSASVVANNNVLNASTDVQNTKEQMQSTIAKDRQQMSEWLINRLKWMQSNF